MAAKALTITDFRKEIPGELSEDHTLWNFPVIKSLNSNGRETYWQIKIWVVDATMPNQPICINDKWFDSIEMPPAYHAYIKVDSGIIGRPPKKSDPTIIPVGKNIGKANATNQFTQALRDALGDFNAQAKKAASITADESMWTVDGIVMYPPMLSQNTKAKTNIDYKGTFVQPKYNGVRAVMVMLASSSVLIYSRRRNVYPDYGFMKADINILTAAFNKEYPEYADAKIYFDSEIYTHGKRLQDIAGDARKSDIDKHSDTFYVFDVFLPQYPDMKFSKRFEILEKLKNATQNLNNVRWAPTYRVDSEEQARQLFRQFTAVDGYEGAMLRLDEPYQYSYNEHHSEYLLKMKPVEDSEFRVTGYTQGNKGKAAGTLIMVCETRTGVQFNVTLKNFTLADAKQQFIQMGTKDKDGKTVFEKKYAGKGLLVYFEELSKDGVPQRAKTDLIVRDWD